MPDPNTLVAATPLTRTDRVIDMLLVQNDALTARVAQLEALANHFGVIARALVIDQLDADNAGRTITLDPALLTDAATADVGVETEGEGVPEGGMLLTLRAAR